MKKTVLQEIKRMNEFAGTTMSKAQEISLIKTRLNEIDFRNQDQFDAYQKQHKLRPATKVTIAGKVTTAGQAAKDSKSTNGSSVFGKDKGGDVFGKKSASGNSGNYGSTPGPNFQLKTKDDWDKLAKMGMLPIKGPDGKTIENPFATDKPKASSGNYGSTPGPNFQLKTKDDWDKAAKIGLLPIKGPDGKTIENPFATDKPKADVKSIVKDLLKKGDKEFRGAYKLKDVASDFDIDDSDNDGKELKARLDKGEDGTYVQTNETEGTIVFNDGSQYEFAHVEDGPTPVTKVGSTKLSEMLPKNIKK